MRRLREEIGFKINRIERNRDECAIAVANTYCFAHALRKGEPGINEAALAAIGWVDPSQESFGAM